MIQLSQHAKRSSCALCVAVILVTACNRSGSRNTSTQAVDGAVTNEAVDLVDAEVTPVVRMLTKSTQAKRQSHSRTIDPAADGWDSEVVGDEVKKQLEALLTQSLSASTTTEAKQGKSILEPSFLAPSLRPESLEESQLAGGVVVRTSTATSPKHLATHAWDDAAKELFSPFHQSAPANPARVNVKVVRVQLEPNPSKHVSTRCLIEVSATDRKQTVEQHMTWNCRWKLAEAGQPTLQAITLESFQETLSSGRWFVDRTQDVIGSEEVYQQQLRHGLNHWLSQIEVTHGMYVFAEYGLAVGDVNGDGLEDVYVCQPGGLPNRLLMHQSDGTVKDASDTAGVDWLDHTSSALFVDFDNDDDQDLAIALESRKVLLLQNDGSGVFSIAQELAIEDRHVQGLCAADYDSDSMVDLYLTVGFADERARSGEPRSKFSYHDANEGGANVLFQNRIVNDRWDFHDVTRKVGLDQNNRRHSLAASWEDFDNDGDQDLYVANDYGQNCLYRNDEGAFTDIAAQLGVVDFGSGMSVSWADLDRDGWMDLYVGNMFSSAGNRITRQEDFRRSDDQATRKVLARFAKGNTMFRNQQGREFRELPDAARAQMGRWAWSSPFADLNNDGWPDLLVANGYVTGEDERDL